MTVPIIETGSVKDFPSSSTEIKPQRLIDAADVVALLVNVDAGQAIEPCRMSASVLYYVIEGSGSLTVEDEQADLQTGSLALVPAGTVRSISATEPMRVLAVQVG
ncbi:MAG: cupin domain-containing protein [Chloroflexota bacterium]|nr:cupin domain-containing protein [Chloroflexota bacterium]